VNTSHANLNVKGFPVANAMAGGVAEIVTMSHLDRG